MSTPAQHWLKCVSCKVMAEFAAHLTSTHGGDDQRPSIFEVLAQENLMKSVQPALRYAAQVLAAKNPARYGRLLQYNEELYALLSILVEHHYLQKLGASFSENFYGLKRVPLMVSGDKTNIAIDETLTRSQSTRSLLCLVLIPYLKNKYERYFEQKREVEDRNSQQSGLLPRTLLAVYPYLHTLWEATLLYYQLSYILGKHNVHSPLLCLAQVQLKTLTAEDVLFQEAAVPYMTMNKSLSSRALGTAQRLLGMAAFCLSSGLSVTMFFLQFLEWWYASDTNVAALTSLPVPPPPQRLQCRGLPTVPSLCPVCLQTRTNDTALMSSGLVYCYPCIYTYVSRHGACPITGVLTNTNQLVKLYEQT